MQADAEVVLVWRRAKVAKRLMTQGNHRHRKRTVPEYIKREYTLHGLWRLTNGKQQIVKKVSLTKQQLATPKDPIVCGECEGKCHCEMKVIGYRLFNLWPDICIDDKEIVNKMRKDSLHGKLDSPRLWLRQSFKHGPGLNATDGEYLAYLEKASNLAHKFDLENIMSKAKLIEGNAYPAEYMREEIEKVIQAKPGIQTLDREITYEEEIEVNGVLEKNTNSYWVNELFQIYIHVDANGEAVDSVDAYPSSYLLPESDVNIGDDFY